MAQSTIIETERLIIVPFSPEHLSERYVSWLNDPEVVRYSDQRFRRHTLESCREHWQSFQGTAHYFWAVIARDPGVGHIGNANAYVDENHSVADIGILIGDKQIWGQGYGAEVWRALCNYLLEELHLRKITGGTISPNKAMLRIMEKAGMVEDGRRIKQCLCENREVDIIYMAMFRDNWIHKK
jgi:RimJ/RimL family protein N-acetyltransferase